MNIEDCRLVIKLDGKINVADIRALTRIDRLHINESIEECAANIAFYGALHGKTKAMCEKQEWQVKRTRSEKDLEIRRSHQNASVSKITQANIESMVETDSDVVDANESYYKLRNNELLLYNFLHALISMKDLLITLSANLRSEQKLDS